MRNFQLGNREKSQRLLAWGRERERGEEYIERGGKGKKLGREGRGEREEEEEGINL